MSEKLVIEEVKQLQNDLEKSMTKGESTERIVDILKGLERIKFTTSLIVSSKIVNTIKSTKKKYPDESEIKGLCKQLIQTWKSIYNNESNGTSSDNAPSTNKEKSSEEKSSESSKVESDEAPVTPALAKTVSEVDDGDDCEKMVSDYPDARKKIITGIAESLSLGQDGKKTVNPVAFPLACGVEAEIYAMFPLEKDIKGYQNKSRKIFFSLKSNAELRQDVLDGHLTVTNLLQLPSEQLATRAAREKAQREREEMMLATRNDYYKITRDQTMRDNGLDPDAGGEHTCSKCKGQKTSSYSLQTRSADEPMTVFVTCLTCGKRWRC